MKYESELDRFRPVPFYFLTTTDPADYTDEAVFSAMQRMKDLGYGGIVLFNKPPLGFDAEGYLSEFWFTLTGRFIRAARQLHLQLWINDGFNYPPGDAAGRIEAADPTLKQHRLMPNPEGRLEILEVPWGFPAFEEPESGEYFRRFVYEEYYKRFAPYFGDGITGFFSDADNRRFNAHVRKECPEKYYPWSRRFPELFAERYGYPVEPHLKELFTDPGAQVQHDYWELCGELYQQWFAGNHAWCTSHNVLYTFHTSDTGPLNYSICRRSSVFTEGDPLTLLSHSDCPGTDHEIMVLDSGTHYDGRYYTPKVTLGGGSEYLEHPRLNDTLLDLRAKYAGSAAVLNGRERVMCEMFAATNWSATFNDLRRIAAWQIIQGINFIVPHAVHHRFRGRIKFFAPPEFTFSTLQHGLRQFNDMLARACQAAAAGEYCAEYAVIDPTRKVWNDRDSMPFFRLCDRLNRRAEGYVIVPEDYAGKIPNVIDPLRGVPELPPPSVTFTGGELAYMRRKLDGTEYLLAANVWDPKPVSGTLVFRGKPYEIALEPGEIAIIGGPFESYRKPAARRTVRTFDGEYPVEWKEPNVIPFDRELRFAAPEGMSLELLIPADHSGKVMVNGHECAGGSQVKVFDDLYCRYEFSAQTENSIELENAAQFVVPALLRGEFDVDLKTTGDYAVKIHQTYLLAIYEPETKQITLTPRRRKLNTRCGWEKQGQIFYSESAEIELGTVEINADEQLELPGFRDIAELLIDGVSQGKRGLAPYIFHLPAGKHRLVLRCWNSMANRMERYAASAGLCRPPAIIHH
ncbi:MAG: hypothetical protein IJS14_03880 [Lentisphaeria bacterium]|nr:hypothetical protein [Lentisphaeria bacterium]